MPERPLLVFFPDVHALPVCVCIAMCAAATPHAREPAVWWHPTEPGAVPGVRPCQRHLGPRHGPQPGAGRLQQRAAGLAALHSRGAAGRGQQVQVGEQRDSTRVGPHKQGLTAAGWLAVNYLPSRLAHRPNHPAAWWSAACE